MLDPRSEVYKKIKYVLDTISQGTFQSINGELISDIDDVDTEMNYCFFNFTDFRKNYTYHKDIPPSEDDGNFNLEKHYLTNCNLEIRIFGEPIEAASFSHKIRGAFLDSGMIGEYIPEINVIGVRNLRNAPIKIDTKQKDYRRILFQCVVEEKWNYEVTTIDTINYKTEVSNGKDS